MQLPGAIQMYTQTHTHHPVTRFSLPNFNTFLRELELQLPEFPMNLLWEFGVTMEIRLGNASLYQKMQHYCKCKLLKTRSGRVEQLNSRLALLLSHRIILVLSLQKHNLKKIILNMCQ